MEESRIQWFPGHMARTRRRIKENLSLVDAVCEIVDARIPFSSRNPDLNSIIGGKPRLIILNKADLADENATKEWIKCYSKDGCRVMTADSKKGIGVKQFIPEIKILLKDKLERYRQKGMRGKMLRVMIVGIPNVGKSSFINKLAGRSAKVEDRPGVTRGNQWFSLGGGVEVMDTPGVLWPKFDDATVGEMLAFTGAVKDTIIDIEHLALRLIGTLMPTYEENICVRFKVEPDKDVLHMLEKIAVRRGMLIKGGEPDIERASVMFLDEFRAGRLGRITLELPQKATDCVSDIKV